MRRYACSNAVSEDALNAWQVLGSSVYHDNPFRAGSLILHRPAFGRSQSVRNFLSEKKLI
jgi:hypothetical protein